VRAWNGDGLTGKNMASNDDVLTGIELEQLMDRLEADFEENGFEAEADLLAQLRARPLHADSMDSIDRLHTLWMNAGDPAAARTVIDTDGTALLQAAQLGEQADIRMLLTLQRLHIAEYLEEEDAVRGELSQMRTIVEENPDLDASQYEQLQILDRLEDGSLDIALETAALRHALDLAMEGHAAFRALDEADYQCRRALAFKQHGRDDEAHVAALAAMAALQAALPDQEVGADDWLRLGDALIEIIPEQLDVFRQKLAAMTVGWTLKQRRKIETRLARISQRAVPHGSSRAACDAGTPS